MCWEGSYFGLLPQSRLITAKRVAQNHISTSCRLGGAQQELDESDLWLELLADSGVIKSTRIQPLRQENGRIDRYFRDNDQERKDAPATNWLIIFRMASSTFLLPRSGFLLA
jgi:hypothetical protein